MSARARTLLAALLALLTAAVFAGVLGHPFIGLDDTRDIVGNPVVRLGLSGEGIRRAFGSLAPPYWHPLTTVSHQAVVEFFGLRAGAHLAVNVLLHAGAAVALFALLARSTGAVWPALAAAALFAVHPLRVESVAWAAERRDVLSGLLWMLALLAHLAYARRGGAGRYALLVAVFVLALLAKPMALTLPLVLLLLDAWPLGRLRRGTAVRLLLEKAPLLLAALPVAAVTALVVGRSTFAERAFPLGQRLANGAVSLVAYLWQAVWPAGLAVFYPHPASLGEAVPAWQWGGALLLVAAASAGAFHLRRRRPWLAAGWAWYLVTVLPVLGVVQNWEQARADRFTYLPLVGIGVAVAWEAAELVRRRPRLRALVAGAGAAAVLALALAARRQVGLWEDPERLFRHAATVVERNWLAESQLGVVLLRRGEYGEAEERLRRALELRPLYPVTHLNLGVLLARTDRPAEAEREYEIAYRQDPSNPSAAVNLGTARLRRGDRDGAAALYRAALALNPRYAAASFNLGLVLESQGDAKGAAEAFANALRADPGLGAAREALERLGRRGD